MLQALREGAYHVGSGLRKCRESVPELVEGTDVTNGTALYQPASTSTLRRRSGHRKLSLNMIGTFCARNACAGFWSNDTIAL